MTRCVRNHFSVLSVDDAEAVLTWRDELLSGVAPGIVDFEPQFLYAYGVDGELWGAPRSNGWVVASTEAPEYVRPLRRARFLWARAFGGEAEVLVWADVPGGSLRARVLRSDPVRERLVSERRLLDGAPVAGAVTDPFVLLETGRGPKHVVPTVAGRAPTILEVAHHLQEDIDTGALRIAASRLTALSVDPLDGGR